MDSAKQATKNDAIICKNVTPRRGQLKDVKPSNNQSKIPCKSHRHLKSPTSDIKLTQCINKTNSKSTTAMSPKNNGSYSEHIRNTATSSASSSSFRHSKKENGAALLRISKEDKITNKKSTVLKKNEIKETVDAKEVTLIPPSNINTKVTGKVTNLKLTDLKKNEAQEEKEPNQVNLPSETDKKIKDEMPPTMVGDTTKESSEISKNNILSKLLVQIKQVMATGSEKIFKEKLKEYLAMIFDTPNNGDGIVMQLPQIDDLLEILEEFYKKKNESLSKCSHLSKLQQDLQEYKTSLSKEHELIEDVKNSSKKQFSNLLLEIKYKLRSFSNSKDEELRELSNELETSKGFFESFKSSLQQLEAEKLKQLDSSDLIKLNEELSQYKEKLNSFDQKLQQTEELLKLKANDDEKKNETIQKLKDQIDILIKRPEKYTSLELYNGINYKDEIYKLKTTINNLEKEKNIYTEKIQIMEEQLQTHQDLDEKLGIAENKIRILLQEQEHQQSAQRIEDLEQVSHEQLKLNKLQSSESEMKDKIEKLQENQHGDEKIIKQLKEELTNNRKLLEVRTVAISALGESEKCLRGRIDDINVQLLEKNKIINELNYELQLKSMEIQDLVQSLNENKTVISSEKQKIELLEQNDERCQMLRVQQEAKLSRLLEDMAYLKHTIKMYRRSSTNFLQKQ